MDFVNASLAQLAEQIFCKYQVAGSLPARGSRSKVNLPVYHSILVTVAALYKRAKPIESM